MNVELKFDLYSCTIFIPDGYVSDLRKLQASFLEWVQQQPECIVPAPGNQFGFAYNENHFVEYINAVVLEESCEKAYVQLHSSKNKKRNYAIKF